MSFIDRVRARFSRDRERQIRAARVELRTHLNVYDLSESTDAIRRGRIAAKISDRLDIDREQGLKAMRKLEEASKQIPGIAAFLHQIGRQD